MVRVRQATGDAEQGGEPAATCPEAQSPSTRAIVAATAGMAAAWIAAGSTGLLAHPLRHALTWVAVAVVIVAAWPGRRLPWKERLILLAAVAAAIAMTVPVVAVYNLLAVAVLLAMLSRAKRGIDGRALLITALAVTVLGVYRFALASIPTVWLIADARGSALGRLAGGISGEPLSVGATFGGLDFLVLMAAFYAGWLVSTPRPRFVRAVYAAAAILGGHLLYLVLLSYSTDLVAALPAAVPAPQADLYVPPDWNWADAARRLLPWNVPLLAGVIQLAVAVTMFRWARWSPVADAPAAKPAEWSLGRRAVFEWGPVVLAFSIPLVGTLSSGRSDLTGRKIVAYEHGYVDWLKPVHDRYGQLSAGTYGMLPAFVRSLGGEFVRSPELSQEDLAGADVLMLIHPDRPWPRERLQRIWDFVEGGGSLLLVAETSIRHEDRASSFNEVLKPTRMRVRFDTAISEIGQWLQSYEPAAHPASAGIEDRRNRFGVLMGSSIQARWPARPLLVGRWGWSDPGSDAVLTEWYRYDAGERLGDLVLAADQRLGEGTVVVLGDTSGLTNQGNVYTYVFTGRLLGYLAQRGGNPQAAWRQVLGLGGILLLLGLMAWRPCPGQLAAVSAVLALSMAAATAIGSSALQVLPGGRAKPADAGIAYIDASHLDDYSGEVWANEGIDGLALTLMRNGYLPLALPEVTARRLSRARLLISIAPARAFSEDERETVRDFVEAGGIFICMVGADRSRAIEPLLDDFNCGVPPSPVKMEEPFVEPKPMGAFTWPYLDTGEYRAKVMFYAGWPVDSLSRNTEVIARGVGEMPVITVRLVGEGKVVLIGDTAFARNQNLETVTGEPFYGRYDNAQFWRWLLAALTDQPEWTPPAPPAADESPAASDAEGASEAAPSDAHDPGTAPGDEVSP